MVTGGRTQTTYRADHVGSLLRPPELLQARSEQAEGRMSLEDLRKLEDKCILDALAMQRGTRISVVSDGEYRRASWSEAWTRVLAPFRVPVPAELAPAFTISRWRGRGEDLIASQSATAPRTAVGKKIVPEQVDRLTGHEVGFLKENAGAPFKITMPGVGQFGPNAWQDGVTDKAYSDRHELYADMVQIMRRELIALIDEGVPYIQLDSLRYVIQIGDPTRRQAMIDAGLNPDQELDDTIALDNACVEGIDRKGSIIGLHMCRGNNRSSWASEGSYDAVAEKTFSQLNVDRFLLEYDDERSGSFEALRFIPRDKMVVLGIVSSKNPEIESVDSLRRRIDEAAQYFPIENLAISPQCGFASTSPGNLLTWDEQRRKLELVVETAQKVWG
jgi:5-methyltetrahydropteroyltriglutamate--homocysteine methyltransferase